MNWPIPIATISSHKLQFGRFVIFKTRGGITPVKAADKVNGGIGSRRIYIIPIMSPIAPTIPHLQVQK